MLLHITYVYEAEVIAHRKRNPETREYVEKRSLEIPEVSEADLPVAFRWVSGRPHREDAGLTREIRWSESHGLWEERTEVLRNRRNGEVAVTHFDAEWLKRQCDATLEENSHGYDAGGTFGLFPNSRRSRDAGTLTRIEDDAGIRSVRRSTADERWGEIRSRAYGMLLMDGRLMRRGREPVYEASGPTSIFETDERRFLRIEPAPGLGGGEGLDHYRADEVEHMLGSLSFRPGQDERIEVLIPEAVRAPLPEMALMDVAVTVLNQLDDRLKDHDRAFFDAYADVRDILRTFRKDAERAYEAGEGMPDGAPLVGALQAALPACGLVSLRGDGWVEERVRRACDRYDARSLALVGPML